MHALVLFLMMHIEMQMEMTTHTERPKSNEEESSPLVGLTADGDYMF